MVELFPNARGLKGDPNARGSKARSLNIIRSYLEEDSLGLYPSRARYRNICAGKTFSPFAACPACCPKGLGWRGCHQHGVSLGDL